MCLLGVYAFWRIDGADRSRNVTWARAEESKQDAQLSQRDRAAVCVIVFAKSKTLELGDNDLRTL